MQGWGETGIADVGVGKSQDCCHRVEAKLVAAGVVRDTGLADTEVLVEEAVLPAPGGKQGFLLLRG